PRSVSQRRFHHDVASPSRLADLSDRKFHTSYTEKVMGIQRPAGSISCAPLHPSPPPFSASPMIEKSAYDRSVHGHAAVGQDRAGVLGDHSRWSPDDHSYCLPETTQRA